MNHKKDQPTASAGEPHDEDCCCPKCCPFPDTKAQPSPSAPLRCKRTGNPCGTDTWMKGFTCPCENCQVWLAAKSSAPLTASEQCFQLCGKCNAKFIGSHNYHFCAWCGAPLIYVEGEERI